MQRSFIGILLLASLAQSAAAGAAEDPGVIRWAGEVVLSERFVLPEGATLVVEPGTLVRAEEFVLDHEGSASRTPGPSGWLDARGRVIVNGTPDAPVLFRTFVSLAGRGADGSVIRHAAFDGANAHGCALSSFGADYRVEASRFSNHTWAVCVSGGSATFVDNVFIFNGFLARDPREAPPPPCDPHTVVYRDGAEESAACPAPPPTRGAEPGTIGGCWTVWSGRELCRGTGGADRAISVSWGDVTIERNAFAHNEGGVWINRNASATVRDNEFVDNRRGLVVAGGVDRYGAGTEAFRSVLVEGNVFRGHGDATAAWAWPHSPVAIDVFGHVGDDLVPPVGPVLIRNNSVRDNEVGIHAQGDVRAFRFVGNVLVGNVIGLSSEHARVVVEDGVFDNRVLDVWVSGQRDHVRLVNSSFDPEKVRVDGDGVLEHDGGVIRHVSTAVVVVSGMMVGLAVVTEAGRWFLAKGALAAAYSRLARSDLLLNATRERLVKRIHAEPGAHLRDLARYVGSYGAAVHHLSRLEREGLVKSARDGTRRRFYPVGAPVAGSPIAPLARRLMDLARERPGIGVAEAARALGCSKQLASYHARALAAQGFVELEELEGGGRAIRLPSGPAAP